jgi:NAD-dependent deacetylase
LVTVDARIVTALREAKRVVILTGAGVSAESRIPTFRDKQTGLWENFDAAELATQYAFQRDPALVWGWYEWRRAAVLAARPNAAHRAIAAMSTLVPHFTLITQNVDDLHERAGSSAVLHLHGQLARPYCEACRQSYVHPVGLPELPLGGARIEPPRCEAELAIRPEILEYWPEGRAGILLTDADWEMNLSVRASLVAFIDIALATGRVPLVHLGYRYCKLHRFYGD